VATPGTGAIYTMTAGLARGARASVVAALACTVGIVPHLVLAITGLAALLHASAVAFSTIKYLGVAYLLHLAWTTWRDRSSLVAEESDPAAPKLTFASVLGTGIVINLLNPKLTIFFFAFLPMFVSPAAGSSLIQMLVLSGVFMAMTFVVFAAYGVLAAAVRRHVVGRPRVVQWMRRAFAVSFVTLGAKLALTSR